MPSSIYLTPDDYAAFGLPSGTTEAQVVQASALVDAFLQRPEGLIWEPDSTGQPCCMAALDPTISFKLSAAIAPGANVPVQLLGPTGMLQPGDVLVLDRGVVGKAEACVVTLAAPLGGPAQVTLQNVLNAHDAEVTADLGLVPEEQRYVPDGRPLIFISRPQLVRVVSGVGRYGYGRRGDSSNYQLDEFSLLAAVTQFGGPPVWELFQGNLYNSFDYGTGQVWIPSGVLLSYYSEVKLRYVAGFSAANLPSTIKQACANLLNNRLASGAVPPNFKLYKAGDTQIEQWAATQFDADTALQLTPYKARAFA